MSLSIIKLMRQRKINNIACYKISFVRSILFESKGFQIYWKVPAPLLLGQQHQLTFQEKLFQTGISQR